MTTLALHSYRQLSKFVYVLMYVSFPFETLWAVLEPFGFLTTYNSANTYLLLLNRFKIMLSISRVNLLSEKRLHF